MNIFILDEDPVLCARYHCDRHVVKMILESAQMMCTAVGGPYKPTHINHPCNIWVRESIENFDWLYTMAIELGKEYTFRYGKIHKSIDVIHKANDLRNLPLINRTPFAQAMPDQYKDENAVKAYRNYYRFEKKDLLQYKNREPPRWLDDNEWLYSFLEEKIK
jgi:hypothetical protein